MNKKLGILILILAVITTWGGFSYAEQSSTQGSQAGQAGAQPGSQESQQPGAPSGSQATQQPQQPGTQPSGQTGQQPPPSGQTSQQQPGAQPKSETTTGATTGGKRVTGTVKSVDPSRGLIVIMLGEDFGGKKKGEEMTLRTGPGTRWETGKARGWQSLSDIRPGDQFDADALESAGEFEINSFMGGAPTVPGKPGTQSGVSIDKDVGTMGEENREGGQPGQQTR